jgi:hypothetical protein
VFSRRAFEARLEVLSLGRPFFESLVFTFWIIILQSRSPNIVATCKYASRSAKREKDQCNAEDGTEYAGVCRRQYTCESPTG